MDRTEIAMSAYLIFMRDKTLDEHELATYSKELLATLAGREVKVLALHGSHMKTWKELPREVP
jgi:hypothetical protein